MYDLYHAFTLLSLNSRVTMLSAVVGSGSLRRMNQILLTNFSANDSSSLIPKVLLSFIQLVFQFSQVSSISNP